VQQSFVQTLAFIDAAGTLYNTFTTAKSLLTSATATAASQAAIKIPAGSIRQGTVLTLDVAFGHSWASGNTMIFDVRLGPTANIVASQSATLKVTTTGGTTEPLYLRWMATCRAHGSGTLANVMAAGFLQGRGICPAGATAAANYAAGMGQAMWTEAVPAVGTGFDSTVDNIFDIFCTMGTSSASNGIQVQQLLLQSHNIYGV
jgi:hypothetical protein